MSDVHVVLYVDCTKLGVLSQHDINLIGTCAEKVLGNNPSRSLDDGYKQNSFMIVQKMFFVMTQKCNE